MNAVCMTLSTRGYVSLKFYIQSIVKHVISENHSVYKKNNHMYTYKVIGDGEGDEIIILQKETVLMFTHRTGQLLN